MKTMRIFLWGLLIIQSGLAIMNILVFHRSIALAANITGAAIAGLALYTTKGVRKNG